MSRHDRATNDFNRHEGADKPELNRDHRQTGHDARRNFAERLAGRPVAINTYLDGEHIATFPYPSQITPDHANNRRPRRPPPKRLFYGHQTDPPDIFDIVDTTDYQRSWNG